MSRKTITLFVLFVIATCVRSQQLVNDQIDVIAGSGVYNANCVIYYPANYNANYYYPLVIFTHGVGEAGTSITKLYNTGLPKVLKDGYKPPFDFIMVAPQRASYSVDPAWLKGIIEESNKRWKINNARIYITGLSGGGWACYGSQLNIDTILAKKFAAIEVNSGATQDANKNNFDWFKVSRTPVWAVVGGSDPSYRDQNIYMVDEINKRVPNLAMITIRAGIGHGGWNDVYKGLVKTPDGKNMWEWLYQFTSQDDIYPPAPMPANQAPIANAGSDVTIVLPETSVILSGTGSDADGTIIKYSWTKISGPAQFEIVSPTSAQTALNNLEEGVYEFQLQVTDDKDATNADVIVVTVSRTQPIRWLKP